MGVPSRDHCSAEADGQPEPQGVRVFATGVLDGPEVDGI